MWKLLSTIEQIQSLKVNGLILQHPSNDSEASTNPTGQEENSNIYRLHSMTEYSLTDFDITIELLPNYYIFGDVVITSMKRSVNRKQLLNGKWWIEK
ncbi:MAG: hypothetical protein GZ094_22430 [Mariniphaga sp.]|nr:hypothetical protein [Mariniphaga sp.]